MGRRHPSTVPVAVTSLHDAGRAKNDLDRPADGLRLLRRALARLDALATTDQLDDDTERQLRAGIWISIASSESQLNGLQAGLAALATAAEHIGEAGDRPRLSLLYESQLGYMRLRSGELESAVRHLDVAEGLIRHAEPIDAYRLLLNRGTAHLLRGGLVQARPDLASAAEIAQRQEWPIERAKARHNLGYLEYLAGNLATALKIMDEVRRVESGASLAIALLDRARALLAAGLYRDADDSLASAEELFRQARLSGDVGETQLARAECALLDGEVAAAQRMAAAARARFRRRGNERAQREARLVLVQVGVAAARAPRRVAADALELADQFGAAGLRNRERDARLYAAEALLQAGLTAEAREQADRADAGGRQHAGDPLSARMHRWHVRAAVHAAGGEPGLARREIRTGLAALARQQARFGSVDLQTAMAVHGRRLVELDLTLALGSGRPAEVLAAVERGRAAASRIRMVEAPEDEVAAGWLAELRQAVEELGTLDASAETTERAAGVRRRIAELQDLLRARDWQIDGTGRATAPASAAAIEATLGERAGVLVSYFQTGTELYAVVVDPADSRVVHLGSIAPALEAARRLRAAVDVLATGTVLPQLQAAVTATLRRNADELDRLLIAPLRVRDDRLVLSPTGELAAVAWNLLPSLRGRPVVAVPSATAWLTASSVATGRGSASVTAFAGPRLVHAAGEAAAVSSIWPGATAVTREAATREALRRRLAEDAVVHVAAHGRHNAGNPLFSHLQLNDGPLYAYELRGSGPVAEHVVLSACEVGEATIRPGDEAIGFTSVLLRLGCRSVVSSVANVHDDLAAEVMTHYHRLLAAGHDSAESLAQATSRVATTLPAPFVCFGATWSTTS